MTPQLHVRTNTGSSMIGSWPEPLQERWDRDLRTVRFQLEEENSKVRGELEEITSNFNSYKIRAQTGRSGGGENVEDK